MLILLVFKNISYFNSSYSSNEYSFFFSYNLSLKYIWIFLDQWSNKYEKPAILNPTFT